MKNWKKLSALVLAGAMVFSLAACSDTASNATPTPAGGNTTPVASTTPDGNDAAEMAVAMITDYGDITDQSFNQTTYEACKAYCDANGVKFQYYKPADDATAERVASVESAIDDGYNVIVMPGYAFGGTVVEVAGDYPDVKFVALDVAAGDILEAGVPAKGETYDYNPANWNVADYYSTDNVYCAVYQEELCGYMAGYAAAKLGYKHLGFLGGMAVPAVIRYGYGFVQGVDAAAAEMGATDIVVEYAYGNQFFGDADITAYMDNWYQNLDVEVVFACGGGIFTSAAEAAAKVDGGKVIGVDVDQKGIIDGAYGEGMTVTSAMKGLAPTVDHILSEIAAGNWANYVGKIETLGLVTGDDPEGNYVQIPVDSTQWGDGFSQDDYKALVKAMFDGTITVSNDVTVEPGDVATTIVVNSYGNIK